MSLLALGLVLSAAFVHATWNLYAKKVGGGAAFLWLFSAFSNCFYAPFAFFIIIMQQAPLNFTVLLFIAGSGLLHMLYFLLLQRGYAVGDLSLVYPLARGTGPMLSTLLAIALFGERPSPLALTGAFLIIVSVLWFSGGVRLLQAQRLAQSKLAVVFGLLTGSVIASYTLWDSYAVRTVLIAPLLLDWASGLGRTLLLTPLAWRQWHIVEQHWQEHRKETLLVALLSSLSYILVLTALQISSVSYVAPAREVSILIAVAMGTRFLKEGEGLRKVGAAVLMIVGIVALTLG